MKIIGLDQRYHEWSPKYKKVSNKCSKLHRRARNLIRGLFPFSTIYEEVALPGSRTERRTRLLRCDFYIPDHITLIEVHGSQHYKYNPRYHKGKMDFLEHQSRDRDKKMWCEINNIRFIELPYNENNEQWEKRITG